MKQDSVDNHSQAAPALSVAVLGAGIVGLNCAFWLQRAGIKVTLIDTEKPGLGASFGNAGLFADYGRLPFANYAMLRKIPKMLLDKQSPLAIDPSYTPQLLRYGIQYIKACRKSHYEAGKQGLLNLHSLAQEADKAVIEATNSQHLISQQGFMGLFSNANSFADAKPSFKERQLQGVALKVLNCEQVKELEPQLKLECAGAVYYPNTRHTIDPAQYCQSIFAHFIAHGGAFLQQKVAQIAQTAEQISLHSAGATHTFDQLVVATGAATKQLVSQLQLEIPQVCERGYHLMLKAGDNQLTRPIAWMNQGVHMTPMQSGIRVAGTAEYTHLDSAPSERRKAVMLGHAKAMLGNNVSVESSWVGSRPTTPDSLPVIAKMKAKPNVTLAFGHGHLGLTLASVTGKVVADLVTGKQPEVDISAFSAERFN